MIEAAKLGLARLLCSEPLGRVIGALFRNRIPTRGGLKIFTPSPPLVARTKAQLFFRMYESAEHRFIRAYLRPDLDIVELGSSIGVISAELARRLPRGRKLVCVEANPGLVELVRRNVAANAGDVNVAIRNAAIDHGGGRTVELSLGPTTVDGAVGRSFDGERAAVPATTLREVLAANHVRRFVLVCDIEGAEAGVLFEEPEALGACEQMIVELHDTVHRGRRILVDELSQRIEELGLRERARHGPVRVYERVAPTTATSGPARERPKGAPSTSRA